MSGEDRSASGGTIDAMRPSARVFIELQEDPGVFSIRFNHDFWAGVCVRSSLRDECVRYGKPTGIPGLEVRA